MLVVRGIVIVIKMLIITAVKNNVNDNANNDTLNVNNNAFDIVCANDNIITNNANANNDYANDNYIINDKNAGRIITLLMQALVKYL